MSFRVVLARPRGNEPLQFEGVYLHNGGSPAEMGPILWTLMRDRYAFDAAAFSREMIDANLAGWSNIHCFGGPLAKTWDGRTKLTVEHHQENLNADIEDLGPVSYQGDPKRQLADFTEPPINESTDSWDAELVYVVGPDGLAILRPIVGYGPIVLLATHPWGDEPDWDVDEDALNDAYAEHYDEDEDDDDDDADEDPHAHETPESNAVVRKSFEYSQQGKVLVAQKLLLDYFAKGGARTPVTLANLFFTFITHPLPPAKLAIVVDETLAAMEHEPALLGATLIGNMCIILNNMGRGATSLQLCELAMERGVKLTADCYVGFTYGAYASQDLAVMRRAAEHIERAMVEKLHVLLGNPAVFDNTAGIYVALGDKARALDYVRLCKEHRYENFAAMPSMPEYASLKEDPEFAQIFR